MFAQAYRLQWFSPLNVVCERTADLSDESLLILRIAQALGSELRRSKIEIGAGQFGVLPHGRLGCNALIPHHLRRRGALLEELRLLEHPAISVSLDPAVLDPPLRIPLGTVYSHGITSVRWRVTASPS